MIEDVDPSLRLRVEHPLTLPAEALRKGPAMGDPEPSIRTIPLQERDDGLDWLRAYRGSISGSSKSWCPASGKGPKPYVDEEQPVDPARLELELIEAERIEGCCWPGGAGGGAEKGSKKAPGLALGLAPKRLARAELAAWSLRLVEGLIGRSFEGEGGSGYPG